MTITPATTIIVCWTLACWKKTLKFYIAIVQGTWYSSGCLQHYKQHEISCSNGYCTDLFDISHEWYKYVA